MKRRNVKVAGRTWFEHESEIEGRYWTSGVYCVSFISNGWAIDDQTDRHFEGYKSRAAAMRAWTRFRRAK